MLQNMSIPTSNSIQIVNGQGDYDICYHNEDMLSLHVHWHGNKKTLPFLSREAGWKSSWAKDRLQTQHRKQFCTRPGRSPPLP